MKYQIQITNEVKNSSRTCTLTHETRGKKVKIVSMLSVIAAAIVFIAGMLAGCQKEVEVDGLMKPKSDYEFMLKKEVDGLLAQEGLLGESFLMMHGFPVWENLQWVKINSKNMIVVPLLTYGENKKCIVGVITKATITAVITELSAVNSSENRILSLDSKLLHDKNGLKSTTRLKNGNESHQAALKLLTNGGNAQDLYNAANGSNSGYSGNLNAGNMCIMANASGSGSSSNTSGHAWLTFTDSYGNKMTFGTWGFNPNTGSGNSGYYINAELNRSGSMHCVNITYNQMQSLLNYNNQPGNTNWGLTYNCAGYATGAWKAVTGQSIGGGLITTPSHVNDWINNQ